MGLLLSASRSTQRRRTFGAALGALVLMCASSAAFAAEQIAQATPPRPAVAAPIKLVFGNQGGGSLTFLPLRVALDKGYLRSEGINLEVIALDNPGALGAALESGSIDIAVDGVAVIANNFQKGISLRVFAGMLGRIGQQLVVRKDSGIPVVGPGVTWKQVFGALKGKTLALPGVSSFAGLTVAALAKDAGVESSNFTMVETGVGGPLIAALASKQADGFLHASTTSLAAVNAGVGVIAVDLGRDIPEYFGNATYSATIALDRTLKKHPTLQARWQRALGRAVSFIRDPANAQYLEKLALTEVQGMPGAKPFPELAQTIASLRTAYSATVPPAELDKAFNFYQRIGLLKGALTAKEMLAR